MRWVIDEVVMRTEDGKATKQKRKKGRLDNNGRRRQTGGEDGNARPLSTVSVGLSSLDATCLCDTNEKERLTEKKPASE